MWKFRTFKLIIYLMIVILPVGCSKGGLIVGPTNIGNNNSDVYVALGDSITKGRSISVDPYPRRVGNMTGKTVINQGVSGARSKDGVARIAGVLSRYAPAGIFILFGANDIIMGNGPSTTIANLRTIIQTSKANQTRPIIASLTPMYDSHVFFQGEVNTLNNLIKQLARDEGIDFVDLASAFGNNRSLIQRDGLHPSDEGTQIIASEFAKLVI